MLTEQKLRYMQIASNYTERELADILHVNPRTIRRYANETGIRPKPTKYTNRSLDNWRKQFNTIYQGQLELKEDLYRDEHGHIHGTCKCIRCHTEWSANIGEKIRTKTGCIVCDKGNHGNKYDKATVEIMMNQVHNGQWKLISYGHYSKKDSIIRCRHCGYEQTIKLDDFINTTTMRCVRCQTGSFGEYVIATALLYNNIPFEREKIIQLNNHKYRLDFLIDNCIGLEYSGDQHFEPGLYYNPAINHGVTEKQSWCKSNGYEFVEIRASYKISEIIKMLSDILQRPLDTPTSEFFKQNNPDMQTVLSYMKTHSARQTMKDLNIPVTKIRKYVILDGYQSISDWQSANKIDI